PISYVQIKIYLLDKPWIQSSAAQRAVHAPEAGKRTEYIQTHRINNPVMYHALISKTWCSEWRNMEKTGINIWRRKCC
ncbi:hypothetical protein, partial [Akkermansia sp.]|uniref:hypothetical protein n=1 Tax=Akkermansia sp. TaxID=1872421 RepID=UPI003AAD1158